MNNKKLMFKVKKMCRCSILLLFALHVPMGSADPLSDAADMLKALLALQGIQTDMLVDTGNIFDVNQAISEFSEAQLKQLEDQWAALTKAYGMSSTNMEKEARLWSSDEWSAVLNQASGGNNQRFVQLMEAYADKYPILEPGGGQNMNTNALIKNNYTDKGKTLNAALATSEYVYNDINPRIKRLEDILAYVDDEGKNQNEKAAMDLNSRMVAELAFIQLEMLKMQSVNMQMNAIDMQNQHNLDTISKQFIKYKTQ